MEKTVKYKFSNTKNHMYYFYNHESYPHKHSHMYWEITLITDGTLIHFINGERLPIRKNYVCVIRPNDCHSLISQSGTKHSHINLVVETAFMQQQLQLLGDDFYEELMSAPYYMFAASDKFTERCLEFVCHLQMTNKDSVSYSASLKLLFLDLVREIFAHRIRHTSQVVQKYPPVLQNILNRMHDKQNFTASIKELCDESNYSHSHIIRIFKQFTNTTPVQLFNTIRLNYAKNLLESTNYYVTQIANEVGYTISNFNINFKSLFHTTPSQYCKNFISYLEID